MHDLRDFRNGFFPVTQISGLALSHCRRPLLLSFSADPRFSPVVPLDRGVAKGSRSRTAPPPARLSAFHSSQDLSRFYVLKRFHRWRHPTPWRGQISTDTHPLGRF